MSNGENTVAQREVKVVSVEMDREKPAVVGYEALLPDFTLFTYEVQQGYRIFRELLSDQYKAVTYPFMEPVDAEGLGLLDYYTKIENPMCFRQIESKFNDCLYQGITEIVSDMRLILENCYRYNGSHHWISKLAQKLEKILDQKLALLNRSVREKVTLHATMAFRNKNIFEGKEGPEDGRRRRSSRTFYANGINAHESSRLVSHLMREEVESQKEIKRLKEKERKEANEALMLDLEKWENEIFTGGVLKELRCMWEVPAIGSFLWLFQQALNLPELNFTEFEHGLCLPHKSQQIAWIFTSLLVTPSQRKNIHKKIPMKFEVWEKKLKERMDVWYLAKEDEELQMVGRQVGLNTEFFEKIGDHNPLEAKSYLHLTLHQRVLILKVLCDECLDYDPQLRDFGGSTDANGYRGTCLGHDGNNCSYLYFPVFDATDVRIYKQSELPPLAEWCRRWRASSKEGSNRCETPKRSNQSRSRKPSTFSSDKKRKSLSFVDEGFELVCCDVQSLRVLCETFSEHPSNCGKKARGRPRRKRCEKELHRELVSLSEELGKSEMKYSKARIKGMVNLMKDWKTEEHFDTRVNTGNHLDVKATANAVEQMSADHISLVAVQQTSSVSHGTNEEESSPLCTVNCNGNRKRRFPDYEDRTSDCSAPLDVSESPRDPSIECSDGKLQVESNKDIFGESEISHDRNMHHEKDVVRNSLSVMETGLGKNIEEDMSRDSTGNNSNGHLGDNFDRPEHPARIWDGESGSGNINNHGTFGLGVRNCRCSVDIPTVSVVNGFAKNCEVSIKNNTDCVNSSDGAWEHGTCSLNETQKEGENEDKERNGTEYQEGGLKSNSGSSLNDTYQTARSMNTSPSKLNFAASRTSVNNDFVLQTDIGKDAIVT